MSFGNIIKKLRSDNNMTQEQLADTLSISPQAVSRWETNVAMPDISLLPTLANVFDVSTDYLLEVDLSKKEKEIDTWIEKARHFTQKGQWCSGIEVLRVALKKHPVSYKLMDELANALFCSPQDKEYTEQEYEKMLIEITKLEETVLEKSKDFSLRYSAIRLLCWVYRDLNVPEKAEPLAETMPSMVMSKEELLSSLYNGTKRFKENQSLIMTLLDLLLLHIPTNAAPLDDNSRPYNYEEMVNINKKVIDILNIMFEDGNYGFFRQKIAWTYLDISWFCANLKNREQALRYLELAKEQAIINDETYDFEAEYTCLLFRGQKHGTVWHNIKANDSLHQIEYMQDNCYDFIRNEAEFQSIIDELNKHSGIR